MSYHGHPGANPGHPGGFPANPPVNGAPPRPAALELATWTWAAVSVLFWLAAGILAESDGSTYGLGLVFAAAFLALFAFGCWKFRSGSNRWRVFFTILSGCYALLVPFGLLDPAWSTAQTAFSVVIGALALAGLVCAWLPDSNRYFHATAQHRNAVQAQQRAEFLYQAPPPQGPPAGPQPGWDYPQKH